MPIDLNQRIRDLLGHTRPLPDVATFPHPFYHQTGNEIVGALNYLERRIGLAPAYQNVAGRHLARIYRSALVDLVENFERFLKHTAAVAVDAIAEFVVDDRFDRFTIKGSILAAHFDAGGVGEALCEAVTWLDNKGINDRFRDVLDLPGGGPRFVLFREDTPDNRTRYSTLNLLWQVRHTIVHNVGVVTRSDATKLRVISQRAVPSPALLAPERIDLRYVKVFLDEMADDANRRIGGRLAEVLSAILQQVPGLFPAQQTADTLSTKFQLPLSVGGTTGVVGAIQ
jgi:hypothetical protein